MPGVLITGANGFIGSACLQAVAEFGLPIHVVSRRPGTTPGCSWHRLDLMDGKRVTELLAAVRPTHLLHLAWITTPGKYWTSPENDRWLHASLHLVQEFVLYGGRRALVSGTCAEYDWSVGGVCDEETTPICPGTPYGRCKHALHENLVRVAEVSGLELIWARLFFLYGPGENPLRLVPSTIVALLRGQPTHCTSGTQQRDFLHVKDAGDALTGLLFSRARGTFNVASGQAIPVAEVVKQIGCLLCASQRIELGRWSMAGAEPPLLVADVRRLYSALGWAPRFSLTEGLEHTIAWWRRSACAA